MKKWSLISWFLIVFSILALGCTKDNKASLDTKDMKYQVLTLNVSSASDDSIIATEGNDNKYQISNSQLDITDDKGNHLSWKELKDAKVIEVHYSGKIKEVSPAVFKKIIKVVIIS